MLLFSPNNLSSQPLYKNLKITTYKTIILPILLYGCDGWCLTLREERRLKVFENRILRRIFGPKRDAKGEWRRLHKELHSLYHSRNIVRMIKSSRLWWACHVARMEEGRNDFKILTVRPTGKRTLGRPRRRWLDNIRMNIKEIII